MIWGNKLFHKYCKLPGYWVNLSYYLATIARASGLHCKQDEVTILHSRLDAPVSTFVCLYTDFAPMTLRTVWTQQRQRMFAFISIRGSTFEWLIVVLQLRIGIWCELIVYVAVLQFHSSSDMYWLAWFLTIPRLYDSMSLANHRRLYTFSFHTQLSTSHSHRFFRFRSTFLYFKLTQVRHVTASLTFVLLYLD